MKTHKTQNGSRVVITLEKEGGFRFPFSSRLYVNHGETATLITAKHKTMAGVQKWAAKVMP